MEPPNKYTNGGTQRTDQMERPNRQQHLWQAEERQRGSKQTARAGAQGVRGGGGRERTQKREGEIQPRRNGEDGETAARRGFKPVKLTIHVTLNPKPSAPPITRAGSGDDWGGPAAGA
eukprot:365447-Chlamydomonas_euryale.AAC.27